MPKLTMEHVDALCHAEFFVDAAISKLDGSRMRKSIEDDLQRIAELKLFIIQQLCHTDKLFDSEGKPVGHQNSST